jgi:sugar lactone lactonase YvrE
MRIRVLTLALACAAAAACSAGPEPAAPAETTEAPAAAASPAELPATIVAERGGFIPEGIEYDAKNNRILTGSLAEGSIFQIHPDGRVTPVVTDPELVSSVGIEAHEERDRLYVANSSAAVFSGPATGHAKLGVYNLTTGQKIAMVDLGAALPDQPADAKYFANDVTVADDGTAYVTDTMRAVIYRVSPDHQVSVFHRFQPAEGLMLNGIVHHDSGYLLVAGGSTIYRVPLDKPEAITPVKMAQPVAGQDGIVLLPDGRLAIVSNSENRVVALRSTDDWTSAEIAGTASFSPQGTTAAVAGDDVLVVHPHFADQDPPSITRVTLP